MNDKREEPPVSKKLADALLEIDTRLPDSLAQGREAAKQAMRRDRRQVRILTWVTASLFLLMFFGIGFSAWFYYVKVVPTTNRHQQDIRVLETLLDQDLAKQAPASKKMDLLQTTAMMTIAGGQALFVMQAVTLIEFTVLLAIMLAAACCTVLLIIASRRATLRQIQASLVALSVQFEALQRSLASGQSASGS
jgi:hypothetical protein